MLLRHIFWCLNYLLPMQISGLDSIRWCIVIRRSYRLMAHFHNRVWNKKIKYFHWVSLGYNILYFLGWCRFGGGPIIRFKLLRVLKGIKAIACTERQRSLNQVLIYITHIYNYSYNITYIYNSISLSHFFEAVTKKKHVCIWVWISFKAQEFESKIPNGIAPQ